MPAVLVFLAVFIGALMGGAILAYPVHIVLSWFMEPEFHRVISRTTLLSGLVFSLWYLRHCGLLSLEGIGWSAAGKSKVSLFLTGFAAGTFVLVLLTSSLSILGIYHFDPNVDTSITALAVILVKALLAGLLVGLVEELIFRGALLSGLAKQANVAIAVVLTSLLYAAVHFIKFRALAEGFELHWLAGIEIYPAALFRFRFWPTLDSFITLFILGTLLATVRLRSQSVIPCIGIHAGIVLVLKVYFYLANYTEGSKYAFLVNKYDHQFGYLASAILLLSLVIYYFLSSTKDDVDAKLSTDN